MQELAVFPTHPSSAARLMDGVEAPDCVSDKASGKDNLVVRPGLDKTSLAYAALMLSSASLLIGWSFFRLASGWGGLLTLSSLLPAALVVTSLQKAESTNGSSWLVPVVSAAAFAIFGLATAVGCLF